MRWPTKALPNRTCSWATVSPRRTRPLFRLADVVVEIGLGVVPAERGRCCGVAFVKIQDARCEVVQVSEVGGADCFSLQDRHSDPNLNEPGRVRTGRGISFAVGHACRIRRIEQCPLGDEPMVGPLKSGCISQAETSGVVVV
jgi:hypothetical protein